MTDLWLAKDDDPYFGWTSESIKLYIEDKPLKKGDLMLVVYTQAMMIEYVLAEVLSPDSGRQHRVTLNKGAMYGGTSFYRTGKNCWSPTGHSKMIPPVPEVMVKFTENPNIKQVYAKSIFWQSITSQTTLVVKESD